MPNQKPVFSKIEWKWVIAGLTASAIIILFATFLNSDRARTFVGALGAVGQVGIAGGLYFLTKAQVRLTEAQLVHAKESDNRKSKSNLEKHHEQQREAAVRLRQYALSVSKSKTSRDQKKSDVIGIKNDVAYIASVYPKDGDLVSALETIQEMGEKFENGTYNDLNWAAKHVTLKNCVHKMMTLLFTNHAVKLSDEDEKLS